MIWSAWVRSWRKSLQDERITKVAFIVRCQNIRTAIEEQLPDTVPELMDKILSGDKGVNFLVEHLRKLAHIQKDMEIADLAPGGLHRTRLAQNAKTLGFIEAGLRKGPKAA